MVGRTVLALSALTALARSKAIVTNSCPYDVYVWSVVEAKHYAENLPLKSGEKYVEQFRYGTPTNPGVAIKVSPFQNGIHEGKDEVNFAYAVDLHDPKKIWTGLSNIRGSAFFDDIDLLTCDGSFHGASVTTRLCKPDDDIELVLCASLKDKPSKNSTKSSTERSYKTPGSPRILSNGNEDSPKRIPRVVIESPWSAQARNATPQPSNGEVEPRKTKPGKKPKVNIGWYVDHRLENGNRNKLQKAFDNYYGTISWSDTSGSDTDYGWAKPADNKQAKRATRSYKDTCDLVLKMFGGTDCEKRARELKDAALARHPSKSDPEVHFGTRFSRTGIENSFVERESLEKDLKSFFAANDWSSSSGSGTPYGEGHLTRLRVARKTPKVSRDVACQWLLAMYPERNAPNCETIVNDFSASKKVYLGKPVKEHLPGLRPKDVEKNFNRIWPEVEWSDDEH
ncbi:hypothetical protein BU24DRAFT_7539 [Aaosphaeria arxii CBS 175.79]|uniref:Uncharacterized protein n=1 Tax=Aaosphaeria arxii CBS 175.79 TaxID=1450172 RepID=A0A6A5Y5E7_9PLEO|nr:uncharacterized protein BU24DRAFT_7539 [Aaosphaeria arxii CBS 175.79]KAF2020718.1 hypothetical protein BU24DRAFT_7539 [Aaosphaeria arxii CBS 175.79]